MSSLERPEIVAGPSEIWTLAHKFRVFRYDVRYGRHTRPTYVYIDAQAMASRGRRRSRSIKRAVATRGRDILQTSLDSALPKRIVIDASGTVHEQLRTPGRVRWWVVRVVLSAGLVALWSRLLALLGVTPAIYSITGFLVVVMPQIYLRLFVQSLYTPATPGVPGFRSQRWLSWTGQRPSRRASRSDGAGRRSGSAGR